MKRTILSSLLAAAAWLGVSAAANAQETKLLFATVTAPTSAMAEQVLRPWAARVNEQGKGVLQLDVREGFALANYGNVYSRVLDDVVQVAFALQAPIGGQFKLSEVAGLPFMWDDAEISSVALWRLYQSGAMNAEYADVYPIMLSTIAQSSLHLSKPPRSFDDLGGLKVMGDGRMLSQIISLLGATPISLQINEVYEGIQRNTLDGVLVAWTAFPTFKLAEVTTYHADSSLGTSTAMVFMSKKKYDSLPAAARKIINDNSGEKESRRFGAYWQNQNNTQREIVKGLGAKHTVINLSPQQTDAWAKKAAPAVEDWTTRTPGGAAIIEKYKALLVEVKKGS
jgi:TRAP-type C4-dicarboxylate transport system substrate-binding protein